MQTLFSGLIRFRLLAVFCAIALLAGCASCEDSGDDGNGGLQAGGGGTLQVSPISVSFSQVAIGESDVRTVTVRNVSPDERLRVFSVELEPRDGGSIAYLSLTNPPSGEFDLAPGESRVFEIEYAPTGNLSNSGQIAVDSSDTRDNPRTVPVNTLGNRPELVTDPEIVRFPPLPPTQRADQMLYVRNYGTAPLTIYEEPVYSGGGDFRIEVEDRTYPVTLLPFDAAAAEQDPEDHELAIQVHYAPQGDAAATGEILIRSNDTSEPDPNNAGQGITIVDVMANADAPCILVDGTTRRFGQTPLGGSTTDVVTVTNCGTEVLTIDGVEISANSADDEFALDLGSWDANGDARMDDPVDLTPGENTRFSITYTPRQEGSDTGEVIIRSNDPVQPELPLELVARGSDGVCPEAKLVGKVRGDGGVARPTVSGSPLDYVILDGSGSEDPDGRIPDDGFEWTVLEKPDGAQVNLGPTREDVSGEDLSQRELRLLLAGTYKVGLTVVDNEGFESCNQAVVTITAIPNEKLHIELTWTNPEDPDESDRDGSDVDLHLAKMGPGQWFEAPYDIYYANPNSSSGGGGGIWQPESPSLDIDDTNGGGPENIQMDDPANCEWYAVGVNYFRQLFGTAYVTVRVYVNERKVFEQLNVPLRTGGVFWDVARIHWNQGEATIYGVDQMIPTAPRGSAPEVTPDMASSGLCSSAALY